MRSDILIKVLSLFLILGIVGCKTTKLPEYSGPVPDRSEEEIFSALKTHNYEFEWYACETSISLDTPDESVSGKAYIRMKKDSIIWVSVKKIAEVVRMLATEDTYAAVNRLEQSYQKGKTKDAFGKMGLSLDFLDVQQAIFGNVILPDSNSITIQKEDIHYIIKGVDGDLQLKYWINAYDLELDKVKIIDYRGREINVDYEDYRTLDSGHVVPFYRHYLVPYDNRGDAEIFMKVKKIEIDIVKKTRFSIPSYYDRIN